MARETQNNKWKFTAGENPTQNMVCEIKIAFTTSARITVEYLLLQSCDPKCK